MKQKKTAAFCSDRISDEYLEVNSCGIEKIFKRDRGSLRPDGRKDYHVIYVEKGILNLFLDGEWKRLPEGSVVLFRPGERQEYKYLKDDKSISHYIHFSGGGCEKLLGRLGINGLKSFVMGKSHTYEELSERLVREFTVRKPLYVDFCSAYLYQMLNIIGRKYALGQGNVTPISASRINAVCRKIYDNMKKPPSVEELAADCCVSQSRFVHLFKEVTGKSVTDFVTSIRVERAKELLVSTDLPVREISETVGYDDQNYFSRRFLKAVGISPRDYRKNGEEN